MMEAPEIPAHFPCWVKAVYSWGGETKHDLGFMEGDYIECLNAGDGSWWTGRLKRDRRMIGQFPSNFVKVLDHASQPTFLRTSSSIPSAPQSPTPPSSGTNTPSPQKNRSWRKPFTAYYAAGEPSPQTKDQEAQSQSPLSKHPTKPKNTKTFKPRPYSSMKKPELSTPPKTAPLRPPSPKIPKPIPRGGGSRVGSEQLLGNYSVPASPLPNQLPSRVPSPVPTSTYSRAPSPQPYLESFHEQTFYQHTPNQGDGVGKEADSPSPPPPPAHRIVYTRQQTPVSEDEEAERFQKHDLPRTPSPAVSQHTGMTPSPLRDAMNDVMTSLDGMRLDNSQSSPLDETAEPANIWSPEAYDELYGMSARDRRPNTSIGFGQSDLVDEEHDYLQERNNFNSASSREPPDHLKSYMHRIGSRLRQLQQAEEDGAQDPFHGLSHKLSINSSPPATKIPNQRPASSHGLLPRPPSRSGSSHGSSGGIFRRPLSQRKLNHRKSAFELGGEMMARTFTTKSSTTTTSSTAQSSSTDQSNSTRLTGGSVMSGYSAGGFSATSAGSLARRKFGRNGSLRRPNTAFESRPMTDSVSGASYHSSHDSHRIQEALSAVDGSMPSENGGILGGLSSPEKKKRGFFKKFLDSAKTSAASARSNMDSGAPPPERPRSVLGNGLTSISGGIQSRSAAKEMGLGGSSGVDWVQMRRDVNRANSLSRNERNERAERCQMMDIPVTTPCDIFNECVEGDEGADGSPVTNPTDFQTINMALVDKGARFVTNLPGIVNAKSLAQTYLCRPHRSDVQRLRAIFTWVAERVAWEEDYEEADADINPRRVIQSRRGSSREIALLVREMCLAVGVHAEVVRGYLKSPGEVILTRDLNEAAAHPNHWWNAVVVDNAEWRVMDCSLANPTSPRRSAYSSAGPQVADPWYFLARPSHICHTHVPLLPEQQHVVSPVPHDVLMSLPCACPAFFKHDLGMWDYDTSLLHLEGLEMSHIQLACPDDVEMVAEVECRAFRPDSDGDLFDSGDTERVRALAQAEFVCGPDDHQHGGGPAPPFKRYTIKAHVPSSPAAAPHATLNVYAGKRGLQHGIASNPHALALALPLTHDGGPNPPFAFFARHPTPHALRHEIYVAGPLCRTLALNNTFVFAVRQHPANPNVGADRPGRPGSPNPARPGSALAAALVPRPGSAMSMASVSMAGSTFSSSHTSDESGNAATAAAAAAAKAADVRNQKPAKLAIQSPSGKILRMTRKGGEVVSGGVGGGSSSSGGAGGRARGEVKRCGSNWESIIKIGERGTWRGLVLADRSARWCVFGEWEAV